MDLVFNASDACLELGCKPYDLQAAWSDSVSSSKVVRFNEHFHCAYVEMPGIGPDLQQRRGIYVINGRFPSERQQLFTGGKALHYYVLEWDASALPWQTFNSDVIGSSDPTVGSDSSVLSMVRSRWKELGL